MIFDKRLYFILFTSAHTAEQSKALKALVRLLTDKTEEGRVPAAHDTYMLVYFIPYKL